MTNVAEELSSTEGGMSREHVLNRVADWKERVSNLYSAISGWLPSDVQSEVGSTVQMHEDLMKRFGIPSTSLPVLEFSRGERRLGKLVPIGLWIIGANGRVDLHAQTGHAIIVDRSENFSTPNWFIASADERRRTKSLDAGTFREALGV